MAQERFSELLAVVATIDPDAATAATYTSDVVDMLNFRRLLVILQVGEMQATSTIDLTIKGDTASGGSFATTITGKAITQLTAAGSDSDKQVLIDVTSEEVRAQGYRYVRAALVVGTAASDCALVILGGRTRYRPAYDYDLASVDEIIT